MVIDINNRYVFFYYKIDKEKLVCLNGMYNTMKMKE